MNFPIYKKSGNYEYYCILDEETVITVKNNYEVGLLLTVVDQKKEIDKILLCNDCSKDEYSKVVDEVELIINRAIEGKEFLKKWLL